MVACKEVNLTKLKIMTGWLSYSIPIHVPKSCCAMQHTVNLAAYARPTLSEPGLPDW